MRLPAAALAGLLAIAAGGGIAAAALSSASSRETPALLGQQRAQLALVARQLLQAQGPVQRETERAREAWPLVAEGLPRQVSGRLLHASSAAATAAQAVPEPKMVSEAEELSGPAARIARSFRSFMLLSARGWQHIAAAARALASGDRTSGFWRANVGVYITGVYDGSVSLSSIGEKVKGTYERLGEGAQFGSALPPAQVATIEAAYSPQADQMRPLQWSGISATVTR